MATELNAIPTIPDSLREAALFRKLILFVGAGVSRLAGCPGWPDFADGALRQLVQKGQFTYSQLDQIKDLPPRVKLSIANSIEKDTDTPIDYEALLHPKTRSENPQGRQVYSNLFALADVFVTTNYDRWLDDWVQEPAAGPVPAKPSPTPAKQMRSIYKVSEFLCSELKPNTVVHLHGSVADRDSMILTTRQYIDRYANDHRTGNADRENRALSFLEDLFDRFVLFIGYGLEELEILEYVIGKASELKKRRPAKGNDPVETRHFLLQGFFSHQEALREHMRKYYAHDCGIQLIDFSLDYKGHEQLVDVLDEFRRRIPKTEPLALLREQELEELAKKMEPLP